MRPENARMRAFLAKNGIDAVAKYMHEGTLRGSWRLYKKGVRWNAQLANQLAALGFAGLHGPLDWLSGNGGEFSVFVRGHDELKENRLPQ